MPALSLPDMPPIGAWDPGGAYMPTGGASGAGEWDGGGAHPFPTCHKDVAGNLL